MLFSAALSYTMFIHGNRRSRDFFQLATASSSSANNSLYVDYYTYIESTRVVRKPRATRCLRENARLFSYGSVHGDVMRRRVRSRAVIARYYACTLTSTFITYVSSREKNYVT